MVSIVGSSPLTRGKPPRIYCYKAISRLIPAHAGKTTGPCSGEWNQRAHPRSRGENFASKKLRRLCGGSSPLTRGKLLHFCCLSVSAGLIPAHAGKTEMSSSHPPGCRTHPRSRGENDSVAHLRVVIVGSSPLTRGKRSWSARSWIAIGLIPAHAGKTPDDIQP